jgi:hypothetical protein
MKKGQTMPLAILTALGIFIIGFTMINFLLPEIDTFRTDMGCANVVSLTDGGKVLCLIGDGAIPYFILGVVSLAIGGIIARMKV